MADKSWYKSRGYIHFTPRLNTQDDLSWLTGYVRDPKRVSQHAFFPLLHKKLPQRRYKVVDYNDGGKAIRSHIKQNREPTKKVRPIHYAAHLDAQIYAYYAHEKIQKPYEAILSQNSALSECVSAYRRIPVGAGRACKNNIHFAADVFNHIKSQTEGCCALAFDIEGFFNSLDHQTLKKAWCKLLGTHSLPADHYNVFKSITIYHYAMLDDLRLISGRHRGSFDERKLAQLRQKGIHAFFEDATDFRDAIASGKLPIYINQTMNDKQGDKRSIQGIPQGLPISAVLANLYLLEFDKIILEEVVHKLGGFYRRYSDDIVVICGEAHHFEVKKIVEQTIQQFHLRISTAKTEICFFRPEKYGNSNRLISYALDIRQNISRQGVPFRYLGFEFYGYKTLIKSSNLSKFYRRMKSAVKTRVKRMKDWQEQNLETRPLIYKRKLHRMFTHMGRKNQKIWVRKTRLEQDPNTRRFKYVTSEKLIEKKYRGNVLTYAWRAADILKEPAIKRQFRRCRQILKKTLKQRTGE